MMAVTITTAGVVELVDTGDLKSPGRKAVRVQVPSRVPIRRKVVTMVTTFLFSTGSDGDSPQAIPVPGTDA